MSSQFIAKLKFAPDGRVLGLFYNQEDKSWKITLSEDTNDAAQKWIITSGPSFEGHGIFNSKYPIAGLYVDFSKLNPEIRFGPVSVAFSDTAWKFEFGEVNNLFRIHAVRAEKEVTPWNIVTVNAPGEAIRVDYKNEQHFWSLIWIRDLKQEEHVKVGSGEQVKGHK